MASYFYDLFVYVCMYKSSEGRRDAVSPGAGVTGVTASWYRLQGQNPDPLPEHWVIWTTELSPAPGLSYFKCALFPHLSVRKHPRTKEIQITSSVFKVKAYVSIELVNCSLQIQLLSLRLMLSTVVCVFVRMVLSTYENQMWQLHGEPWQQPALRKREADSEGMLLSAALSVLSSRPGRIPSSPTVPTSFPNPSQNNMLSSGTAVPTIVAPPSLLICLPLLWWSTDLSHLRGGEGSLPYSPSSLLREAEAGAKADSMGKCDLLLRLLSCSACSLIWYRPLVQCWHYPWWARFLLHPLLMEIMPPRQTYPHTSLMEVIP